MLMRIAFKSEILAKVSLPPPSKMAVAVLATRSLLMIGRSTSIGENAPQ